MSKIKLNKPMSLFFHKSDGTFIKLDIQQPTEQEVAGEYLNITIKYEEGFKILKNATVIKRNTLEEELIYDISWEEEEWEH